MQHKAFRQFDYPPVQVPGLPQTQPVFHCKKIENDIGVKVAEKSGQSSDQENTSIVLNLLSGRQIQNSRGNQFPMQQSSSLSRTSKTKPRSAQNQKSNPVRTSGQHRQYETMHNPPQPIISIPGTALSTLNSFDKPLQVQRTQQEYLSHQNQRRRPQSSQTSKTRKEEHHGGLLKNQKQRIHNSSKKPRVSSPSDSYNRIKGQNLLSSQSNTNLESRELTNNIRLDYSEAQLPRQLFPKTNTAEKLSTIKHSKESFAGEEMTMNNMIMEQNTVSSQNVNLMNQLLMLSKPLASSKKPQKGGTSAVKKKTQKKTTGLGSQGGTMSPGLSSKEASADKKKYYTHDDKENIQLHSNKKKTLARQFDQESSMPMKYRGDDHLHYASQKTLTHKPSSEQILLSTDIINKLKQELTKQVKKRQDSKTTRKQSQFDPKQSKHLAGVIPFDQKIKMRQQKIEKQQILEQEKLRQQEQEEQKKKRQLIKFKREMERKENMAVFQIFKKQVSPHSRKASKKPSEFKGQEENQDIDDLDKIMVHRLEEKGLRTPDKNVSDLEDKEDEDEDEEEDLNIINIPMQKTQRHSPSKQGLISSLPSGKSTNPYKKDQNNPFQDFKSQFYNTKQENYDSENENRHQNIDNFLKEQKVKRIKEKNKQEEEQTKRLTKIKSQLINLQQDYFKGLKEFKQRQVQQQQALNAVKSQERKKSKKKKKVKKSKLLNLINQQKQKLASPFKKEQKVNYNLSQQRNSMPVMQQHLATPNMQQRASFQSPSQRLNVFEHLPIGNQADEVATSAQSRSSLGSSSKKIGNLQRDSILSQYSLPKNRSHQPQHSAQNINQLPISIPSQTSQMPFQIKLRSEAQQHSKNQSLPLAARNNQQIFKTSSAVNLLFPGGSFHQNNHLQQTQPIELRGSMYEQSRGGSLERHGSVDKQSHQIIDLKSEKSARMFEQFARIRKELEKQLKFEKKSVDREAVQKKKTKKKPTHFLQQQKVIAKQRQARTEQMPLQQVVQYQTNQDQNQLMQTVPQEHRIQVAKTQILDKLHEVAERMQNHFKQQKQQNPLKQSHQTLMLSHTNIIKEEESKDDTSYQTTSKRSPSPNRHDMHQISQKQQLNQLRMGPLNVYGAKSSGTIQLGEIVEHHTLDSQEVSQIAASKTVGDDQNNTTYLLKKMYEDNNRPEIKILEEYGVLGQAHLETCVNMIQKHFRGFICRKILKEKMRIDKEFRLLRQKYEVKSSGASSQTPLSSLAFSQSNPRFIKRIGGDHNLLQSQPHVPLPFISSALGGISQGFHQMQSPLNSVQTTDQRIQNPFYNKSDILYQKEEGAEANEFISKFSVLKSPSIMADGETNRRESNYQGAKSSSVFDYQPIKLQFQDSHLNQILNDQRPENKLLQMQNFMGHSSNSSQAFSIGQINQRNNKGLNMQLEEGKGTEEDRSFVNDSERSIMPIDEPNQKTPFQLTQEKATSQSDPLSTQEDHPEQQQIFEENLQQQHRDYLDSPLKMNDLSGEDEDKASSGDRRIQPYERDFTKETSPAKQANMKRIAPKPISNNQERQSNNQVRARGISPIGGISPRNLFQQKSSFDISSLINYGDNEANKIKLRKSEPQQNQIQNEYQKQPEEEEKQTYIKIHGSQELASNFSDGSPIVIEDDASPQNQNQQTKRKDDSISHNTSIFEKNSFQQFAKDKIHKVFKAESELEKMIDELNQALKKKIKIKEQELKEQQLSVRTYNRKKLELEKWVEKEKREIKMTKKHFTQGCLRLSSLLDTLIKEQGRMKDAVSSIRKQNTSGFIAQMSNSALGQVRRSHSFDSELLPKQYTQQLSESITEQQDLNTVTGARRQSLEYFSEAIDNGADENSIRPLYNIGNEESKKLFDYMPITPSSTQQQNLQILVSQPSDNNKDDSSEEEQLIEIKGLQNELKSQQSSAPSGSLSGSVVGNQNILVEELKRREDAELGAGFLTGVIDETSNNGLMVSLGSQMKDSNTTTPDETMQNNLQVSDTQIYKDNGQIKFSEEIQSMEDLEKAQEHQVNFLVEEILQGILLRDIKERLFPPRPLSKLMKQKQDLIQHPVSPVNQLESNQQQKGQEADVLEHQKIEKSIEDQIKVLDNILDELAPPEDSRIVESPEAVAESSEISIQRTQSPVEEEKINEAQKISLQEKIKEVQRELTAAEEKKKRGIDSGILQVNTYMQDIFERLRVDKVQMHSVLENVSQPLYKDPLMILAHLQNSIPEPPPQTIDSNESGNQPPANPFESAMPFQQSVLSVDLYLDIEKEKRGGLSISQMRDSFQEDNSQSFVAEMENIHNKAIFDAVNEALDGFRPYGLRGPPLPWSKQSKTLTFKFGKEETFEYLLQKVKYRVLDWSHVNAGTLGRPTSQREKDHLELIREERLARILIQEAEENEQLWTDYEYEETQTKIDTADIILEHLCSELAEIMLKIGDRKFEEDQPKEESV